MSPDEADVVLARAKTYPVIKPRENSFVFDLKDDTAIEYNRNAPQPLALWSSAVVKY